MVVKGTEMIVVLKLRQENENCAVFFRIVFEIWWGWRGVDFANGEEKIIIAQTGGMVEIEMRTYVYT